MMNRNLLLLFSFLLLLSCKQSVVEPKQADVKQPVQFQYQHEVRLPKTPSTHPPLLILLHGLGSNEKDLFSFAQYLDPRLVVVSPRAPIAMGDNRYSWFNLTGTPEGWTYDIDEVRQSSKQVLAYIDQLITAFNIDPDKVFIGGFSQGAIMSLATGLKHSDKIKGIICLSGRLYPELKPELSSIQDYNDLDLFISHGRSDEVLPYSNIVEDIEYLQSLGLKPTIKYYDAAHTISQENFQDMVNWISQKLN